MRESIKDVERAQEWGQVPLAEQLSLTERAEQHSTAEEARAGGCVLGTTA